MSFSQGFARTTAALQLRREGRRAQEAHDTEQSIKKRDMREHELSVMGDRVYALMEQYPGSIADAPPEVQVELANFAKNVATNGAEDGTTIDGLHVDSQGTLIATVTGKRPDGSKVKKGAPMSVGGGTTDDPIKFKKGDLEQLLLSRLAPHSKLLQDRLAKAKLESEGLALMGANGQAAPAPAAAAPRPFQSVAGSALTSDAAEAAVATPVTVPPSRQATQSPGPMASASPRGLVAEPAQPSGAQLQNGGMADYGNEVLTRGFNAADKVGLARDVAAGNMVPETAGGTDTTNPLSSAADAYQVTKGTFGLINRQPPFNGSLDWSNPEDQALAGAQNLKNEFDNYKGDPQLAYAAAFIGRGKVDELMEQGGLEALLAYEPPGQQSAESRAKNGPVTVGSHTSKMLAAREAYLAQNSDQNLEVVAAAQAPPEGDLAQRARERAGPVSNAAGFVGDVLANPVDSSLRLAKSVEDGAVAIAKVPGAIGNAAVSAVEDKVKNPNRLVAKAASDPKRYAREWATEQGNLMPRTPEEIADHDATNRKVLPELVDQRSAAIKAGDTRATERLNTDINKVSRAIATKAMANRRTADAKPVPPGPKTAETVVGAAETLKTDLRETGTQKSSEQLQADKAIVENASRPGNTRLTQRQLDAAAYLFAHGKLTAEQLQRFAMTGKLEAGELKEIDPTKSYVEADGYGGYTTVFQADPVLQALYYSRSGSGKLSKEDQETLDALKRNNSTEGRDYATRVTGLMEDFIEQNKDVKGFDKLTPAGMFSAFQEEIRGPFGLYAADNGYMRTANGQPAIEHTDPGDVIMMVNAYQKFFMDKRNHENRPWYKEYLTDRGNKGPQGHAGQYLPGRPQGGTPQQAPATLAVGGETYSQSAVVDYVRANHPQYRDASDDEILAAIEAEQAEGQ